MIYAIVGTVSGLATIYWGLTAINDSNCASISLALQGRTLEVTCFPSNSSPGGPIPGKIYALAIIVGGIIFLALGYVGWNESKKRKHAKSAGNIVAIDLFGELSGQCPAALGAGGAEGNLFWTVDKFLFIPDNPFPDGSKFFGPIHFGEVPLPRFRVPVISNQGFRLTFGDNEVGLTFTSSSGKLKNLMKIIQKYRQSGKSID